MQKIQVNFKYKINHLTLLLQLVDLSQMACQHTARTTTITTPSFGYYLTILLSGDHSRLGQVPWRSFKEPFWTG